MPGTLFLVPTPIAETPVAESLPATVLETVRAIEYFLAENAKSARAFLKLADHPRPLREIGIVEIGHDPDPTRISAWIEPILGGKSAAVVSEAGCPGIADPGSTIVAAAHEYGIPVRALVGPSSIVLALMSSGLNGQQFRFVGYLRIDTAKRAAHIAEVERESRRGQTQIFIETPYRSEALFDALLDRCAPTTRLAVASNLTAPDEYVRMQTIAAWKNEQARPPISRKPTIFCLLA